MDEFICRHCGDDLLETGDLSMEDHLENCQQYLDLLEEKNNRQSLPCDGDEE